MSVQPALAEAAALSQMQMAAFEGEHRERQLIRPFTRLKDKKKNKKKGSAKTIVRGPFHVHCAKGAVFLSTVLMPPVSGDASKIQETSGRAQKARK